MKRIYICGPYSADNIMDVLRNIRNGQEMAALLMNYGYAVFCPFLDYQLALTKLGPFLSKEHFQKNSMSWVEVSDALFILDGWHTSKGTWAEMERAKELNIPIYHELMQLLRELK